MDKRRAVIAACEMSNDAQLAVASYFVRYLYTRPFSQRDPGHSRADPLVTGLSKNDSNARSVSTARS